VDKERRAGAESGGRGKRERRELGADSESPVRRSASPPSPKLRTASQAELCKEVGSQEKRKLRAQRGKARSVWLGLGMLGLIGWSVAIPALLGVGFGVWIDAHLPSHYSWTLMLLLIGTIVGCVNAWRWVANEQRQIHEEQKNHNQDEHRGNHHS
jgi:ATP synthase protein I